jgi:hypothetical protein
VRNYSIVKTNCDCGSGLTARPDFRFTLGPRCPHCRKILGCMEWQTVGKIKAATQREAIVSFIKDKRR